MVKPQTAEAQQALKALEEFRTLSDMAWITIKGHALLEAALYRLLSARLGVLPADLPERIPQAVLTSLAWAGLGKEHDQVKAIEQLTALRNAYAHHLEPPPDAMVRARSIVELANTKGAPLKPWPADEALQVSMFRAAVVQLISRTFLGSAVHRNEQEYWNDVDAILTVWVAELGDDTSVSL